MILGCSYNAFDCLELLEPSIKSVRDSVDYVNVVFQTVSNFGQTSKVDSRAVLEDLRARGLVDSFVEYSPSVSAGGHRNEVAKRNLGLVNCKLYGCSHFASLDCDEMYLENELNYAKKTMEEGDYDSSAWQMLTYWKTPKYILDPPETYHVSGIYKIDDRRFDMSNKWPVLVDPTRRLEPRKLKIFERSEIQLHHMSYVRRDIRSKLTNSSASANFKNRIDELTSYFQNWQPGQMALLAGREERYYGLKEVENGFKINI